jgi:hypothetical protein
VLTTRLGVPVRFNRGGFVDWAYCEMDEVKSLELLKNHKMLTFEITGAHACLCNSKEDE